MSKTRRDLIVDALDKLHEGKFVNLDMPVRQVLEPIQQSIRGAAEGQTDMPNLHILCVDDYAIITK